MAEEYGEVKLLGLEGSPFALRVKVALKLEGVQYKHLEEDLNNKSELLPKYNPVHKKVPVLVHNENPIAESLVIVEYIDETWKTHPILHLDPYHRALARFWSRFIDEKLHPAMQKAGWAVEEKEREKAIEETCEGLGYLEMQLKGKFFGGETIGIVDLAGAYIAFWLPLVEEAVGLKLLRHDKFPKLHQWSQDFCSHPVVRDDLPPAQGLLDFYKARYAAISASK